MRRLVLADTSTSTSIGVLDNIHSVDINVEHCETYDVKPLLMLLMLLGFAKNKGAYQPTHPRISYA